jgi:cell division protein FtsL
MTTILEVQDGILKVQGELEELRKRLQEEMPEAERAHLWKKEELLMRERIFDEGERTFAAREGAPARAIWTK